MTRRSPATIVAAIALALALGGSAIAGSEVVTSALSKSKVKKIAAKQANKLFNERRDELVGPPGQDATNLFAYIRDEGPADTATVHYGSGVTAVLDPAGNNKYTLTFSRSLSNCAVQAVPGYGNPAGSASADEQAITSVSMETGDDSRVDVFFEDLGTSTQTDTAFLVTAFC